MSKPPAEVLAPEVLWWAWSGDEPFGLARQEDDARSPIDVYGLAIYATPYSVVQAFYDRNWEIQDCVPCDSVEAARQSIPERYKNAPVNWTGPPDTESHKLDRRAALLHLISRMHNRECVRAALAVLDASEQEMSSASRMAYPFYDFHPAMRYLDALGPPATVTPNTSADPASCLAGGRLIRVTLPLWPGIDFALRMTRVGVPYGGRFLRSVQAEPPRLTCVHDLVPWQYVDTEIEEAWGPSDMVDGWTDWATHRMKIPESPGAPARPYLLGFDMGLLQWVEPATGDEVVL